MDYVMLIAASCGLGVLLASVIIAAVCIPNLNKTLFTK